MRKITLFLISLFLAVGAMAQYGSKMVYVTDLSQLSNDKVYTLESERCYLMYNTTANATGISSSNSTLLSSSTRPAKNKDDVNQQFKIENINGSYYLYSVGAGKYVTDNGSFADAPQQALSISTSNNSNYIWFLKIGNNGLNSQAAGQTNAGIVVNSWVQQDEGNRYKILDVEESESLNLTFEEVGNPTEDGVYRIYWKQNNRGYLAYHDSYPTKGVLADVTLGSYGSMHFNSASDPVQLEWYLITSEKGNKYLFSAYNGKFLSYSEESADNAKAAYFDAARPCPITIEDNTSHSGYYIIKANVDGTDCLLSSGCGQSSRTGYPIRWNSNISGDMGDGGSPLIFVKVGGIEVDADILARAQAAINDYENPVEADVNFEWTTSTPWTAVEHSAYYTSTVFNDNELDGVKYIEGEVAVAGARTATVTFTYIDGGHKLNIRGVEVIDAMGNIVAGDYHVGTAGGSHVDNTYTVSVAEAGTYKVRCYAAEGNGDQFNHSHGSIVVSFAKLDVMELTKSVTFAAEYATLYLGYKVAIPAGVEAYVLTGVNPTWVELTQLHNVIPANTAVILKGTATSTYNFYYTSSEAEDVEINYLEGSIADRYVQGDAYVLGVIDGEVCLAPAALNQIGNTSFKNNANKAYLKVAPGAALSTSLRFDFDGTTDIENVEVENADAVKAIYDLTGRRVEEITAPGIYIINGKKVLVK